MFCETVCPAVVAAVITMPTTLALEPVPVVVDAELRFLIVLPVVVYKPPALPGVDIPSIT